MNARLPTTTPDPSAAWAWTLAALHGPGGPGGPGGPVRAPGAMAQPVPLAVTRQATRDDEVDDVRGLLLEHAEPTAGTPEAIAAMAETVAVACLGDDHLWQDLQLPARAELTALMRHWFPRLAARNDRDMKWKKFLYKQLCEREELFICKSPTCAACTDYAVCFGPET